MKNKNSKSIKRIIFQYGWALLGTIAAVGILLFCIYGEKLMQTGSMGLLSAQEMEQLLKGCQEDKSLLQNDEAGIFLNGYKLPYDREDNIWYVAQNLMKKDWEGVLDTGSKEVRLYLVDDGYLDRKEDSIREGHVFQAALVKGDAYVLTDIVVTGMPVISIETESSWQPEYDLEDIDNYVYNSETRYVGRITVFDADGNSGTYEGKERAWKDYRIIQDEVTYHNRGNSSGNFEKKGYALKLTDQKGNKKQENLFGLGYSAKWKLLALAGDVTKVKEKTAWQLWEEMAGTQETVSETASAMEYCEVILDGRYWGMYAIMKTLDEDTLGLEKTDVLYKLVERYMPSDEDIQASIDQNYMVCYPIRMRYPEKGVGDPAENWRPIREYLNVTIWSTDFEKMYDMLEIDNQIDYFIFVEAISASDNTVKNTYKIAKRTTDGGFKLLTIPWDLNYAFGDEFAASLEMGKTQFNPDTTQIYTDPCVRQLFMFNWHGEGDRLKEKWASYRENILSEEHILGLMQQNMDYMLATGAFERDSARWPMQNNDSDLTKIMDYERERLTFLDGYFENL